MSGCAVAFMTKGTPMAQVPFGVNFRIVGTLQTERRLAEAAMLGDRGSAEAYARRVGAETVDTFDDGLDQATTLLLHGCGSHVETTATCGRCPLVRSAVPHAGTAHTVGSGVVEAFVRAREQSLELRTPPNTWTGAPPRQLFEPMLPPRIAAVLRDG